MPQGVVRYVFSRATRQVARVAPKDGSLARRCPLQQRLLHHCSTGSVRESGLWRSCKLNPRRALRIDRGVKYVLRSSVVVRRGTCLSRQRQPRLRHARTLVRPRCHRYCVQPHDRLVGLSVRISLTANCKRAEFQGGETLQLTTHHSCRRLVKLHPIVHHLRGHMGYSDGDGDGNGD